MSAESAPSYDASPDSAIAAILAHDGPVIVDLDETLYLRNSTEDFIDCARPGLVALVLLRIVDLLRPWRFTGGEQTRDVWRVRIVAMLMPWTRWTWRQRVRRLAPAFANQRLIAALRARADTPIILTAGFMPIVAPLVVELGFPEARLVAARLNNFSDRRLGKLHVATQALGTETLARSLIVTDSPQDAELLAHCGTPLRTVWPGARYRRALSHIYLPGEYLTNVKRPGERYIMRGILQEDFAFWVLSSVALAPHPLMHIGGLLLLLFSFWAIYERGYVDNDMIAANYESDPKLTKQYRTQPVATPALQPWFWSLAAAALALPLLHRVPEDMPLELGKWMAVLFATLTCFMLYNRLDKTTRIWLYPALQFGRSAAFAVIVPISPMGAAALGAHVMSRWVPYHLYRLGATRWPSAQPELIRAVCFVVLALLVGRSLGSPAYMNWTTLALLVWNIFRARREIRSVFKAGQRLDRRTVQSGTTVVAAADIHALAPLAATPLFSVVIPTHNRARTVGRAINSVLGQTLDDYEIVIVDDGSSDGTRELLAPLQAARCRVVRNEVNVGVSASRNRGVEAARGDVIAFLDDDDEFRPGTLAALYERYHADPELQFAWGTRIIHERAANGQIISSRTDDWHNVPYRLSSSDFLPLSLQIATSAAFSIRRALFLRIGGFDTGLKVSEDRDLFIRLAQGGYIGGIANDALIDVNEGFSSLSRSVGVRGGSDADLRVIEKHRDYLGQTEHDAFLSNYLLVVFAGSLEAGNRRAAFRIITELYRRQALDSRAFRYYLRHAPEFRALKTALRYDALRRIRNRMRSRSGAATVPSVLADNGSNL
jgi:glycosyltransferase involved in cell wall biosynthesis/phosphoserine phosphatase